MAPFRQSDHESNQCHTNGNWDNPPEQLGARRKTQRVDEAPHDRKLFRRINCRNGATHIYI